MNIFASLTILITHLLNMFTNKKLQAAGLILAQVLFLLAPLYGQEITISELRHHIKFLASDELAGRYPGTEGDKQAAEYIRNEFRSFGLKLLGKDGFQQFEVTVKIKAGKNNSLQSGNVKGQALIDFTPAGFSAKSALHASVLFAGYGLQAQNDTFKWDDFKGIDIKGKWCMFLRGTPEISKAADLYKSGTQDRDKAMLAKDLGAAGVILVSGHEYDKYDELPGLSYKEGALVIPVINIKRTLANDILKTDNTTITSLEQEYKKGGSHAPLFMYY